MTADDTRPDDSASVSSQGPDREAHYPNYGKPRTPPWQPTGPGWRDAAAPPAPAVPVTAPDETLRRTLATLEREIDAADEAGEFGECCVDADCRACNVLVWMHDRIAALAAGDTPPAGDEGGAR